MERRNIFINVNDHEIRLDAYLHPGGGDSVLIFPGGGYSTVCSDREGEPIALAYCEKGLSAFVLHYKVGEEYVYPSQLTDASAAIMYIKNNAAELSVDKDRIFAVGFSAGGHLAGSLGLLGDDARVLSCLGIERGENAPAGIILCYPVVSALVRTHEPSFANLLGKPFSELADGEREQVSLERHVSSHSVPAFIWHTSRDTVVPMIGSLELARAYYDAGREVYLGIYPYGEHGVALGNEVTFDGNADWIQPLAQGWVDESVKWIRSIK